MEEQFDYIVVGAGSAGSAIANRLSADPGRRVLLLEAGPKSHPLSRIPISFANLIDNPAANWCYRSEPEAATGDRQIPVPRGRLLGGSSAINGMVWVRGQCLDFDTWAQLGNRGWSYADVAPIFKRIERYEAGGNEIRGAAGPLRVSEVHDDNPLYETIFRAADQVGLARNPDYNGLDQEGICRTQATISNGRRMSTAYAYLAPIRGRRNLVVRTGAQVVSLRLEGHRCVGVAYRVGGVARSAGAAGEVILAAGAIGSPQLLEVSGIGRPAVLEAAGVTLRHALPGVGENLRDHIAPRMAFAITRPGIAYNDRGRGLGLVGQVLRYLFSRKGLLSLPTAPVLGFIKTRPELATPDVQLHFVPYRVVLRDGKRGLGDDPGITCTVNQCRPESVGSVHVKSSDPATAPAIAFNFLSAELDRRTLIDGMRFVRRLVDTDALQSICGEEMQPGPAVQTDADLLTFIRERAETAYHPVGTCKMGSDPMAVVDERLRVHGIERLRVADGAIMPTLTSGNTNAPCIMIGEKCADMVLEDG